MRDAREIREVLAVEHDVGHVVAEAPFEHPSAGTPVERGSGVEGIATEDRRRRGIVHGLYLVAVGTGQRGTPGALRQKRGGGAEVDGEEAIVRNVDGVV